MAFAGVGTAMRPAVDGSDDLSLDRSTRPKAANAPTMTTTAATAARASMGPENAEGPPARRGVIGLTRLPLDGKSPARTRLCGTAERSDPPARADARGRTSLRTVPPLPGPRWDRRAPRWSAARRHRRQR